MKINFPFYSTMCIVHTDAAGLECCLSQKPKNTFKGYILENLL